MPPDLAAVPIGRAGELALDFAPAQITRELLGLAASDPLDSEQPDDFALEADGGGVNHLRRALELARRLAPGGPGPIAVCRLPRQRAGFLCFADLARGPRALGDTRVAGPELWFQGDP